MKTDTEKKTCLNCYYKDNKELSRQPIFTHGSEKPIEEIIIDESACVCASL